MASAKEVMVRPVDMKGCFLAVLGAVSVNGCTEETADGYVGQRIAEADRLVVSWNAEASPKASPLQGKDIVVSDRDQIRAMPALFEVEKLSGPHKCNDGPRFEFFRGNDKIAAAVLSHGSVLRKEGSPKDAHLTKKSAQAVRQGLVAKGVPASAFE